VTSAQQRTTAEQVARKTRGVRGVKNQLRVKPGARVSQR
jgi:osmotically-inducible protein OsmY